MKLCLMNARVKMFQQCFYDGKMPRYENDLLKPRLPKKASLKLVAKKARSSKRLGSHFPGSMSNRSSLSRSPDLHPKRKNTFFFPSPSSPLNQDSSLTSAKKRLIRSSQSFLGVPTTEILEVAVAGEDDQLKPMDELENEDSQSKKGDKFPKTKNYPGFRRGNSLHEERPGQVLTNIASAMQLGGSAAMNENPISVRSDNLRAVYSS